MQKSIERARLLYRERAPLKARILARTAYKELLYFFRFCRIILEARAWRKELNVILGAALTKDEGWLSTNERYLDITNSEHWARIFPRYNLVNRLVAEHVLEHLTENEMKNALANALNYLKNKGTFLVAVPDGNHPDPEYRIHAGVNGIGADGADHKQFITYERLACIAYDIGYQRVILLEGYTNDGELHCKHDLNGNYGRIWRSRSIKEKTPRNKADWDFADACTSLIVLLEKG